MSKSNICVHAACSMHDLLTASPFSVTIEYKYLLRKEKGTEWQPGSNTTLTVPASATAAEVRAGTWVWTFIFCV